MTETPQQPVTFREKRKGAGKLIVKRVAAGVVGAILLAGGGYVYNQMTGAPEIAKAGDCLAGASADDLKVVACTDPTATLTVAGRVEDKTQKEWEADQEGAMCSAFPSADQSFWEGKEDSTGYVLCLAPKQ
ncbi:hypothetical protein Acor_24250 [Acrocarpospora corrugata]|uniref:Uncharacterized protein n=1 Tax=Acrocarpospora corrugata TaxID=35763 RepID=A0A5M3VZU6_9ACTN|nr:hypothetical protein [Acrocarpospora corrugata]GES00361.1 hypothetical protein Acor_24250 [Acrocarpospora corrugata]